MWSELGHAQLDNGLVAEAIASYLRSNDTSRSSDVIERSKEVGCSMHFAVVHADSVSIPLAANITDDTLTSALRLPVQQQQQLCVH